MTDIGPWRDAIHTHDGYKMIPVNKYQMGNLLDILKVAHDNGMVNGDWWGEWLDIIAAAMKHFNISELHSNLNNVYTYDDVRTRMNTIHPAMIEFWKEHGVY